MNHSVARKMRRPNFPRVGAVLGALALTAGLAATSACTSAGSSHADQPAREKPSILLVHGAFVDGSSWHDVAAKLQRDGYDVTVAAVPLRGLTYDSAYVKSLLDTMPRKTILVGHSYGGAVITNAATGSPKAAGLVYVAAFVPDEGEALGAIDQRYNGPASKIGVPREYPLPAGTQKSETEPGVELSVDPAKFHEYFAPDLPADKAAVLAAAQRPIAASAFAQASGVPAWKTLPTWDLITRDDKMIPPDGQRAMATRAHATITEVSASHAVTLSQPDEVTKVIETAANTVQP
ncbi:alpha/beta fold hydrolase [Nocardia sp. NBC_00511]|uniref:alpha/beta fold hydrolase n=1 Tax=Nocardia sp. NBC_00511 TaxID=2903591 RepID=UPI0030E1E9D9